MFFFKINNIFYKLLIAPFPKILHFIFSGIFKESLFISDGFIYINKGQLYQKIFKSDDVKMILYTIQKNTYYLYIVRNDRGICLSQKKVLPLGIKYKYINNEIELLISEANKENILVIPTIFSCGLPMLLSFREMDYSIFQYAFIMKESLLSIVGVKNNKLFISEVFSNVKKEIDYNILFTVLNNYKDFFNKNSIKSQERKKLIINILDKPFTLNRGYGLYPFLEGNILEDDIYYSFKEKEMKNKIIELFDKYNS